MVQKVVRLGGLVLLSALVVFAISNAVALCESWLLAETDLPWVVFGLHRIIYPAAVVAYALPCIVLPYAFYFRHRKEERTVGAFTRYEEILNCYDGIARHTFRSLFVLVLLTLPAVVVVTGVEAVREEPIYALRLLAFALLTTGAVVYVQPLIGLLIAPLLSGLRAFQRDGSELIALEMLPTITTPFLMVLLATTLALSGLAGMLPLPPDQILGLFSGRVFLSPLDYDWHAVAIIACYALLTVPTGIAIYAMLLRELRKRHLSHLPQLLEHNRSAIIDASDLAFGTPPITTNIYSLLRW